MAPVVIKNYTWTQSELGLIITVPLKGKSACETDIFTYRNYIKVNAPPFLFELFLFSEIEEKLSKCTLTDSEVVFELKKKAPGMWDQLIEDLDKQQQIARRKEIAECKHKAVKEERAAKNERLRTLQSVSVQEQIDLDGRNRSFIEDAKNDVKEREMKALQDWKRKQVEKEERSCSKAAVEEMSRTKNKPKAPGISIGGKDLTENFPIPLVRQRGTIEVHFSSREFPTPTRESLQHEEKEFLTKQLAARKATGFVSEDLRPEELDPCWLKNKGDSFHKSKNYLGAISAYSHAIKIGSKMPELYSNRSASQLALGNLHKALEDSSTAIELLTPKVAANAALRAKCHARRGAILCQLGLPDKSLPEFQEALKLRPDDEQLRMDFENAQLLAEQDEQEDD